MEARQEEALLAGNDPTTDGRNAAAIARGLAFNLLDEERFDDKVIDLRDPVRV